MARRRSAQRTNVTLSRSLAKGLLERGRGCFVAHRPAFGAGKNASQHDRQRSVTLSRSVVKGLLQCGRRCFVAHRPAFGAGKNASQHDRQRSVTLNRSVAKGLLQCGRGCFVAKNAPQHDNYSLYQPALKSSHFGLSDSINAIFFARSQPLICFSRIIASRTSS